MAIKTGSDSQQRLEVLKKLLLAGEASTQEEICDELKKRKFNITQSTVSRDLRRLGAAKLIDPSKGTIYKLNTDSVPAPSLRASAEQLIFDIQDNGYLIVIHTQPGSASLLARYMDQMKSIGILGTIAGDDTVFVAIDSPKKVESIIKKIKEMFKPVGN